MDDVLVWVDVETTDLKPGPYGALLEIGFRVTDLDLNEVNRFSSVIGYNQTTINILRDRAPGLVVEMHDKSGLWDKCLGESLTESSMSTVERSAMDWVSSAGVEGLSLCGSSIAGLDRPFIAYWMPDLYKLFHYRTMDNSTVKELCRRYNPELFKHVVERETDHRVNTCLDNSIEEFRFYKDNFFFDGRS